MKQIHLTKCKKPEKGWECKENKQRILWAKSKMLLIQIFRSMATDHHPVSLRIHDVKGKFQEERTYPRSADPKKSKG